MQSDPSEPWSSRKSTYYQDIKVVALQLPISDKTPTWQLLQSRHLAIKIERS